MKINPKKGQYSLYGKAADVIVTGNTDMARVFFNTDMARVSFRLVSSSKIIGLQNEVHF
jgi:hypothetical protein